MFSRQKHSPRSADPHRSGKRRTGFTLIEVIGVLAIIAILAAAMIPAMMKSLQRTERQNEERNLETLANVLKDYVLRERIIPDDSTWAQVVADEIAMPLSRVQVNDGG